MLRGIPSPEAEGMGAISSTLVTENALSTSYNPGYLGVYSQTHFFNAATYTSTIPVSRPGYTTEPSYNASAANVGFNLDRLQDASLPLSIGLGFSTNSVKGGVFSIPNMSPLPPDEFVEIERSNMYSIGIAVNYFVQLGIGVTYKDIRSRVTNISSTYPNGRDFESNGTAFDFGVFLKAPLLGLLSPPMEEGGLAMASTKPFLDITTSYNLQNVGPGMIQTDATVPDPFPRNATMGLGVKLGMTSHSRIQDWELVSLTAAREANDLLVSWHNQDTTWSADGQYYTIDPSYPVYDGIGGSIQVANNLLLGKNNGKVEIRSGLQLNLGEILFLRLGSIEHGVETMSTSGFGIHLAGVWQLLGRADPDLLDGGILGFLGYHFDLQFDYADVRSHEVADRDLTFKSLNIIVR